MGLHQLQAFTDALPPESEQSKQVFGECGAGWTEIFRDFITPELLELHTFTDALTPHSTESDGILGHCGAGLGRTGMFLIALVGQYQLEAAPVHSLAELTFEKWIGDAVGFLR